MANRVDLVPIFFIIKGVKNNGYWSQPLFLQAVTSNESWIDK